MKTESIDSPAKKDEAQKGMNTDHPFFIANENGLNPYKKGVEPVCIGCATHHFNMMSCHIVKCKCLIIGDTQMKSSIRHINK